MWREPFWRREGENGGETEGGKKSKTVMIPKKRKQLVVAAVDFRNALNSVKRDVGECSAGL